MTASEEMIVLRSFAMAATLALIAVGAMPAAAAPAKPTTRLPARLIGVWHKDNEDGRSQCSDYKALLAKTGGTVDFENQGDASLIGAAVIDPTLIHAYSDMGEGNFYSVRQVAETAPGRWRIDTMATEDSAPSPDYPGDPSRLELQRNGDVLTWRYQAGTTERFALCGPLPRNWRR